MRSRNVPSPNSRALVRRLIREGVDLRAHDVRKLYVERTYASRKQKADGAWAWRLLDEDGVSAHIGSSFILSRVMSWPAWDLRIENHDISIHPATKEALDGQRS